MKHGDLQKLKFILEEETRSKRQNFQELSLNELGEYVSKCKKEKQNKDQLINSVYRMWENDYQEKTKYQKMVVKNQIIDYIKGRDMNYRLMMWYFKDNQQPFYIDAKPISSKEGFNDNTLKSLIEEFNCDKIVLKNKISEVEALKLKKQIVYYYYVLGRPLINHKEMS